MDNDDLEVEFTLVDETKNCYIYEPEEGGDIESKLYVRKYACRGTDTIIVAIREPKDG